MRVTPFVLRLLTLLLLVCCQAIAAAQPPLSVTSDGRFLHDRTGRPILLNGDTGWNLGIRLGREEIGQYLSKRREQGFNLIGLAALFEQNLHNVYGDVPFARTDGRWEPTKPATTPGSDPADSTAYDYWDHLDYAIEQAAEHGLYLALVIAFNSMVVGNGRGEHRERIVFDPEKAYAYGASSATVTGTAPTDTVPRERQIYVYYIPYFGRPLVHRRRVLGGCARICLGDRYKIRRRGLLSRMNLT